MDIVIWYAVTMALAHAYSLCLRRKFGDPAPGTELGVGTGLIWAAAVGVLSLAFAATDFKSVFAGIDRSAALTLAGGLVCYHATRLGVRYWPGPGWTAVSRAVPAVLTGVYLMFPKTVASSTAGNIMMAFFCIGAGCLAARKVTKGFAYLFFSCLMVFDAYAVWYTDIMGTIINKVPAVIPAGFVHANASFAVGAGDVLFSALGAMIVLKFCSLRWSAAVCVLYVLAMDPRSLLVISGILAPSGSSDYFPLMVTICPITMAALALGSRHPKARA